MTRTAALGLMCLLLAGRPGMAQDALQPYQLVRSLQLIQDRIATGDHAALPMQARLLEMTDARLRVADAGDFKDAKNFRALLVYGMSGGNPITVEAALSRASPDPRNLALAKGLLAYLGGRPGEAIEALKPIDPMAMPAELGAFLALVKGSLLAGEQPPAALRLLDEARLLSPGTLVEEAALRRSVGIAAAQGDAARFALASTQYVERYLYSPYASQFADSFVSGVMALHMSISQDKLADITGMMDPEREKVIYLRIARRAAIEGLNDLSAFASAKAEQKRDGIAGNDDPRALLYASLSSITSGSMDDVRARLGSIDRGRLSDGDRALLDAAEAVAGEVVAPVVGKEISAVAVDPIPAAEAGPAATPTAGTDADASGLPPVEGAIAEQPAVASASGAAAAGAPPSTIAPVDKPIVVKASAQATATSPAPADAVDEAMATTRRQLELIDQMLGAAPR
jgi:chemotaxis protein MotC